MERLDKILSNLGYGTRKEIKSLIKNGFVVIDGIAAKDNAMKIDPEKSKISVNGEEILYRKYIYLMMNKPDGVVSATFDKYDETVIDLLHPEYQIFNPFPVGRLDKDTVGLLILTNDGELNHKLISPKYHVDKKYYAEINKPLDEKDVEAFKKGIVIDDGYKCMPAKLEIINSSEDGAECHVTIQEGKFHQVKRMFEARDKKVVFLKRISFGSLTLDKNLSEGDYRELSEEEIELLKSCKNII
ncbi:pseudouridine synthase [Haloimpatiens lingqiaonensis]|uniref:pseudouridine synthase n=1 Tax=Haloimpatiens lingqiaonensis TaxID=1380675 RepID=UPI0010FDD7F7|nr:pseudouridine synthase [Haloimpatiens lingqiaonensis]